MNERTHVHAGTFTSHNSVWMLKSHLYSHIIQWVDGSLKCLRYARIATLCFAFFSHFHVVFHIAILDFRCFGFRSLLKRVHVTTHLVLWVHFLHLLQTNLLVSVIFILQLIRLLTSREMCFARWPCTWCFQLAVSGYLTSLGSTRKWWGKIAWVILLVIENCQLLTNACITVRRSSADTVVR